jgi:hypothetical protein
MANRRWAAANWCGEAAVAPSRSRVADARQAVPEGRSQVADVRRVVPEGRSRAVIDGDSNRSQRWRRHVLTAAGVVA